MSTTRPFIDSKGGERKIGQIVKTGERIYAEHLDSHEAWVARPQWIEEEQITSFIGLPLKADQEVLGVLAIFSRETLEEKHADWLELFVEHLSVQLQYKQALTEISTLNQALNRENDRLKQEIKSFNDESFIGSHRKVRELLETIDLVAPTDTAVLIEGESGTGKELLAKRIHEHSRRAGKALVRVNCGAIPNELFESEFFGHVKGAFSGALTDRQGRFELADGGTIFLDEIGELPLSLQAKLLRVLQEGEFERVGESKTRKVDVRIIAASNKKLLNTEEFRQDLYYRLAAFPIQIPALRERASDIPLLLEHFKEHYCRKMGVAGLEILSEDFDKLQNYDWPGNVRELQNAVERAVISQRLGKLNFSHLASQGSVSDETVTSSTQNDSFMSHDELLAFEKANVEKVLRIANGRVAGSGGAAELLGIPAQTLYSRLRKLGLKKSY